MGEVALVQKQEWTPDQMRLITDVVARGATPDELKLFLYRCQVMRMDPLKPGQIHFVKYGNGPGTIVVGIDGFRSIAERTGKRSGTKRGVLRDKDGKCVGGWAEVYRHDWQHPARAEVSLAEYTTGRGPWAKMPESMIQKVAEVAALRMAFPDDLGGVYSQEEMDQAGEQADRGKYAMGQFNDGLEGNGVTDRDDGYRIPFGKFKARKIEEIPLNDLRSYVNYLETTAEKKGETIKGTVKEFIEMADAWIAAQENAPLEPGSEE